MGNFVTAADVLRDAAERINEDNWRRGEFHAVEQHGTVGKTIAYGCAMGHLAVALAQLRTGGDGGGGDVISAEAVDDLRANFPNENMNDYSEDKGENPHQYAVAAQFLAKVLDAHERGMGIKKDAEGHLDLDSENEAIRRIISWNDDGASDWMEVQVALKEAAELLQDACPHANMLRVGDTSVYECRDCGFQDTA